MMYRYNNKNYRKKNVNINIILIKLGFLKKKLYCIVSPLKTNNAIIFCLPFLPDLHRLKFLMFNVYNNT